MPIHLGRGEINIDPPKGKLSIVQSFKSLHASLKNLTWTTQQIAKGDFSQKVSFMGDFSIAFNSMAQQLKTSFEQCKQTTEDLRNQIGEMNKARRSMLNILEDLEKAREEADAATKAKSDFLARMSHEIRTPMNAVIGMTHLALQTQLSAKQRDYLVKVQSSAHNLLGIINDILDFSKIEAGKLDIESTNFKLEDVFGNLSNLMSAKAQEKGLELLFSIGSDVPNHLVGDPLRLGQILINLTSNAMKFTEKGEIVILAELKEDKDNQVKLQFSVRDSGIGIPKDKIPKLFEEFTQADGSTTRKYGGTGLGLAICKRLSELMGGTIWAESEPGMGSTFIFCIICGKQSEVTEKKFIPAADLKAIRALVVDDNRDAMEIMQSYLKGFTFEVDSAFSGEEALQLIERNAQLPGTKPFKLILMDWSMPGLDGIETSLRIKENFRLSTKPKIIMMTAFGRDEVMQQAEKAGLDAFLIKPISQSVLFDTVMSVSEKTKRFPAKSIRKARIILRTSKKIRGASVLLVEDNEINQQVATELLEQKELIVSVASNGKEAVEAVENWDYDVVLMDLQMPEMDGFEATSLIRRKPKFKDLPIIAMTAHAMVGDREKSLKAGMNDHVTKPIDPDQLFKTLIKWIKPGDRQVESPEPAPEIQPENEPDLPSDIPGIDFPTGLKRVAGNTKLYRKLLLSFRENNRNLPSDIKAAFEKDDQELAQRLAHTIKGVSGNIAANDVYNSAARLEECIKNKDRRTFPVLLRDFSDNLDYVLSSISILDRTESAGEPDSAEEVSQADLSRALEVIRKLRALLEEDVSEAENQFEFLQNILKGGRFQPMLKKVSKHISEYDIEAALDAVDKLARNY